MAGSDLPSPRLTWWRQLTRLYLVALAVTAVPFIGAWSFAGLAERRVQRFNQETLATAELALVRGQLQEAIIGAEVVLYGLPDSERAKAVKANAHIESYWATSSESDLETARSLVLELAQSQEGPAHTARGNLALIDGDTAAAVEHLQQAGAADPADAYAQHQLGFALAAQGRDEEALVQFRSALARVPDMAWVQANLQVLLPKLERCDEAIPGLAPAVQASCHNTVGVKRYNDGDRTEAKRLFEQAVAAAPDSAVFRANLASALFQLGEYDAAREQVRRSYDLGLRDHWIFSAINGW
jgi:tetratricopeptide (TPR) repeat protein